MLPVKRPAIRSAASILLAILLTALTLLILTSLAGCSTPLFAPDIGDDGGECYGNFTCNDNLVCVRWGESVLQSRCSKPETVRLSGYRLPACECQKVQP